MATAELRGTMRARAVEIDETMEEAEASGLKAARVLDRLEAMVAADVRASRRNTVLATDEPTDVDEVSE